MPGATPDAELLNWRRGCSSCAGRVCAQGREAEELLDGRLRRGLTAGDDRHRVSGDLGVSEWLLTGTRGDGEQVRVRGCDHWEFRGGQVVRKDSYWKIVDPAT